MKLVDPQALAQLRRWMEVGGDMAFAVEGLRRHGFADAAILSAIEAVRPKGNALDGGAMREPPLIRRAPPSLRRIEAVDFPMYTLTEFLSPAECAELIGLTAERMRPSPVAGVNEDAHFRTSTTANLCEIADPRARAIDEKICVTIGIRNSYAEGSQSQLYELGQQYKPHTDAFDPGTRAYARFAGVRGNRTWTFMVYLNDDLQGGATRFTAQDFSIRPKAGMALLWNNLRDDGSPNPRTIHSGEPVTQGRKVIITKWFRVHGDGPVLYED